MGGEFLVLKREDLFIQVWQQPMTKLAEGYGLSDVGLRKICKKLNVPLPPRGYWARKHRKKPPVLPPTKGQTTHEIRIPIPTPEVVAEERTYLDPRSPELINNESNPKNKIVVGARLRDPHPLVEATRKHLLSVKPDDYGRLNSYQKGCLGVSVGDKSVTRVLLILDALVKALAKRGYLVTSKEGQPEVAVLDEKITFTIEEPSKRHDNIVTPEQQKKNPYGYYHRYRYTPTGVLFLKIDRWAYGARQSWKDGKTQRIEECLNAFIVGLVEVAEANKRDRLERQRREEEWRREREEREAKQRLIDEENARREKLEAEAANWAKANQIRGYVEAVKQRAAVRNEEIIPDSNLDRWIVWATRYACLIDPSLRSRGKK